MSAVLIFIGLLTVLIATGYLYVKNAYMHWKRRGVPYLPPSFPFGNFRMMFMAEKSFPECLRQFYNSTDEPLIGLYTMTRPSIMLRDPKIIRDIMVKDFSSFYHRGFHLHEDADPLANNLFLQNGEIWKKMRTQFSPAFTTNKLKGMFDTMKNCYSALDVAVVPYTKSGEICEIREIFARFATNVIASVAFGIDVNCIADPNAGFRKYGKKFFDVG